MLTAIKRCKEMTLNHNIGFAKEILSKVNNTLLENVNDDATA